MSGYFQISTTLASDVEATRLATTLVAERLAACVQVSGPLHSVYRWKGEVASATEWLCTVKTVADRVPDLLARIRALHSYEQPEIIATPIAAGDPGYLEWVRLESTPAGESR